MRPQECRKGKRVYYLTHPGLQKKTGKVLRPTNDSGLVEVLLDNGDAVFLNPKELYREGEKPHWESEGSSSFLGRIKKLFTG